MSRSEPSPEIAEPGRVIYDLGAGLRACSLWGSA